MSLRGIVVAVALLAAGAFEAQSKDGGPTGAFTYSTEAGTAATQREVKGVVERYQSGLNASDFAAIKPLFAADAVAEWNEKRTMVGTEAMEPGYAELFKTTKFTTDFQYDAVDVYGDTAIVRTHHPVGQTEYNFVKNEKKLDFNREIFVLNRKPDGWKIILYTFTTQPNQGEQ